MNDAGLEMRIGRNDLRIDLAEHVACSYLRLHHSAPIGDVAQAVRNALDEPLDFPPLTSAVVPGDRIVIPADHEIPQLTSVLESLLAHIGAHAETMTILLEESAPESTIAQLKERLGERVEIIVHNPDDSKGLGYLAASEQADPIYLNRAILDADFVLPIVLLRSASPLNSDPAGAHLFPNFGDRASQKRNQAVYFTGQGKPSTEPREAAWLLGLQAMVGVVAANGSALSAVIAGTPSGIAKQMQESVTRHEDFPDSAPDLVVACIDGGDEQQTWQNIARALQAARRIVCPGGTIAICSEVSMKPGNAVLRLRTDEPTERLLKRFQRDSFPDAIVAALLLQSRDEGRVLIQSQLPRNVVEELGFGAIDDVHDLERLIEQHPSCTILESAQNFREPARSGG